ncbi:SMI1/KNR4 family protein [Streptomyces goshikiensis]|uniref:SMI1/KNR4 family protein n=1 Tax=Streptomyces TaxID=1883 RepID=UPI001AE879F3|nr:MULTISPECIES: SMI1/KNR4 family protein [Streptomyces]MBP0938459.1 SMI1/KNR4 family protein [Streptomyces sp. KCTC 0041BP]
MSIDALLSLMPPHAGAGMDVDWEAMESAWRTPFPTDYKEFVKHYGAGSVENFLSIFQPSLDASGRMADETSVAQELWEELEGIPGIEAEPDRILTWAVDGTADLLCWLRRDDNPDEWPVVVYKRLRDEWEQYDCGMAEFLVRVFRAEFTRNPISATAMWGVATPLFLTHQEAARIRESGRDPWEGVVE